MSVFISSSVYQFISLVCHGEHHFAILGLQQNKPSRLSKNQYLVITDVVSRCLTTHARTSSVGEMFCLFLFYDLATSKALSD